MVITIFPTFAYQKKPDLLVVGGVCTEIEYAKQAVEMAIEQGEDAALVWLKERSGE